MKKIILTFLISIITSPCFALEHYMLIADNEISDISISDENVVSIKELNSYKGKKNAVIIVAKNIGNSELSFYKGKKHIKLQINVQNNETYIKRVNGIKLISVDLPQELK